ncbi:MAG: PD40 domain-containing protein, partial [Deinococcus sp.]|nr:PD40 domain-containing protein [Deinococcus sp.]
MARRKTAPYGSWQSPITASLVAAGGVGLGQVEIWGEDVYWMEGRPLEGGRYVVVRWSADGQVADMTPPGFNARTLVHEYGGGAYCVHGSAVYFSNFADQRLYRQDAGNEPRPITAEPELPAGARYADGRVTPDGRLLICVRERHTADHQVVNELVALPTDGSRAPGVVVSGNDFYAFPSISPDGRHLAWTTWNHPQMPWDGAELWVADLAADGSISHPRCVTGGTQESIFQPAWSPDGTLHFVSDRTGWWNLYCERGGAIVPLAPMEAEFGVPQWVFGLATYAFLSDGRIACIFNQDGVEHLGLIAPGTLRVEELDVPYTAFPRAYLRSNGRQLACIGATPAEAPAVVTVDVATGASQVLRRSIAHQVDPGFVAQPRPIEFPTEGGQTAHALFYPPANRNYAGPSKEWPPLLVMSHGGPTS